MAEESKNKEEQKEKKDEVQELEYEVEATIQQSSGSGSFQGQAENYMPVGRVIPVMTDEDYIKDRLDGQISYFNRKSSWNQKRYKKIKKLEIYIASLIPVVISLSTMGAVQDVTFFDGGPEARGIGLDIIFQVLAAVAGVILVIFNKTLDLEEHFKFWKDYRLNCEALEHERLLYLTRTEPYDEDDAYPLLVNKVESILNNEAQKWKQRTQQQQQPVQQQQQAQKPKNIIKK